MKNPIAKFRESSIIPEEPGSLSEKLKTLMSPNYQRVYYILLKFCTRVRFHNVYKSMLGIILFCLDLELLIKSKKQVCRNQVF